MLRLRTLGALALDGDEGSLGTAGTQRRRLALFALLVASGERGVSRDKLLAYLWPEADPDRARHALSEMLAALRRSLHADGLFHGSTEVRLDPAEIASDVAEFEHLLDRRELTAAVERYQGPFLEGFVLPEAPEFQRWADRERLRLEQRYRSALEALATDAKSAGDHAVAARWWRRLAEVDPLSTHVAIEVMSALLLAGDHAGALAHGTAHERRVREEFGAAPNQAVRALVEKLQADPAYKPPAPSRASAPLRRSTGRVIGAPSERDSADDVVASTTTSRERGATIAGRYLIERELGRGGMATVFLARDLKHDRDVALKFIHAEVADAIGTERFQSEIAVLAKLQHPHILTLYDSGEVEGALFYVMPFVGGESLRDRLLREGKLAVPDALRLAREVADALAYAHGRGVIHRDVKPENILLSNGHAQVADFGIARAVSRASGRRDTEDGFAVGTPAYMSPEQASGDPIDGRSDEYSLACVLYEMLGGAPPFVGTSGRSVLAQRFTEDPPPIQKMRANVPPDVGAALARALQRVPADRYPTVAEFGSALNIETTAQRPRWVPAMSRRWWWAIGGAILVAIATALFAFRPPPLVADLYVVLPFEHRDGAAIPLLNGDNCERLIYEEFGRWSGVKLVDDMRARDAMRRYGGLPLTLDEALATARSLRAGRLVWGDVWEFADTIRVRGAVYDVARGRDGVEQEFTIRLDTSLRNTQEKFSELADRLLVPRVGTPIANEGTRGTKDIDALIHYVRGHEALASARLDSAEQLFRAAVDADPDYAHALYWLAQTGEWRGEAASPEWRANAERAARAAARLSARDSTLAIALRALADGRFPEACERYGALLRHDSLDFRAWYGLSDCLARDTLVVRDAASPSGWAFRSSYGRAIRARLRALEILPSVHGWFAGVAFQRLATFMFSEANEARAGASADGTQFGAFPALVAETLAFVPYPWAAYSAGTAPSPTSHRAAVEAARRDLATISLRWARAFPTSPDVFATLALSLEATGALSAGDDPERSALAAIRKARALGGDSTAQRAMAITETRLLVLSGAFPAARSLADSILVGVIDPRPGLADTLAPLAALTGRLGRTADLMRRTAPQFSAYSTKGLIAHVPMSIAEPASELIAYVCLAGPVDSIRALRARIEAAIRADLPAATASDMRDGTLGWPLTLAFPEDGPLAMTRAERPGDPLFSLQRAALRHDTVAVRAGLALEQSQRKELLPGELSIYWVFQDAWLELAIGDSAAAATTLDGSLRQLSSLGPNLLDYVPEAAFLVRAMALRARLAAAQGDRAMARSWARAVVALWDQADPELQPTVRAMRDLAALSSP